MIDFTGSVTGMIRYYSLSAHFRGLGLEAGTGRTQHEFSGDCGIEAAAPLYRDRSDPGSSSMVWPLLLPPLDRSRRKKKKDQPRPPADI